MKQTTKSYPLTLSLKHLRLENFRLFEEVDIDFHPNLTVLIGVNGSGKTTILDALAKFLTYALSTAFGKEKVGEGLTKLEDIRVGTDFYRNKITAEMQFFVYDKIAEDKDGNDIMDWVPFSNTEKPKFAASVELRKVSREEDRFYEEGEESARQFGDSFIALYGDRQRVIPPVVLYVRIEPSGTVESTDYALLNSDFQLAIYQDAMNFSPGSFATFEKWFKSRENRERQQRTINKNLDAVRKAIYIAVNDNGDESLSDYANMVFADYTDDHLGEAAYEGIIKVNKNGSTVPLAHLSSGEKRLAFIVAQIAFRMVVANKGILENPFEVSGVVLIDELDAHLHPKWQLKALEMLQDLFPNVQFVVTTHSPLLLSSVHSSQIRVLESGKIYGASDTFGQSVNVIMEDTMGADSTPNKDKIKNIFKLIASNELILAKKLKEELEAEIEGKHPELVKANAIITKKELLAQ